MANNICEICNTQKVFREAGVNRQGKPYNAFWSCPNWKNDDHKNAKSVPAQIKPKKEFDFENFVADEFVNLNERLDKLAEFLVTNLKNNGTNKI